MAGGMGVETLNKSSEIASVLGNTGLHSECNPPRITPQSTNLHSDRGEGF